MAQQKPKQLSILRMYQWYLNIPKDREAIDLVDLKSIDLKLNSNGLECQNKLGRSSSLVRIDFDGEVSRTSSFFLADKPVTR
jgi:hypothetical protein